MQIASHSLQLLIVLMYQNVFWPVTRSIRLGSQPISGTLQAQHKPASGASLSRPVLVQCAAASKDVPSARSLTSGKPPISSRPKLTNRPPLPPPTVAPEGCAARARRPSLEEGAAAIVAPSACPAARAPTIQQLRADALPNAVMNFVAEAGALVEGR